MKSRNTIDTWGAVASMLCALHCLFFPLIAGALPTLMASGTTPATAETTEADAASCCATEAETCATTAGATEATCCDDPSSFWIHLGMLSITFPLAGLGLLSGYRCHGAMACLVIGGAGLASLVLALLAQVQLPGTPLTFWLNMTGSALLITAHLWNRGQCACHAGTPAREHFTKPAEGVA